MFTQQKEQLPEARWINDLFLTKNRSIIQTLFFMNLIVFFGTGCSNDKLNSRDTDDSWPVLKQYGEEYIERIAMPMGGIGTGTISLNGKGALRDWEIMNRPAKGYNPSIERDRAPFFAIQIQYDDNKVARIIEGPVGLSDFAGSSGSTLPNHGLPGFAHATFDAAYPFGQAHLSDPTLPVEVTVRGFKPLIPGNVNDSSIPMVVLTYRVRNTSDVPIQVSVCGSIKNFIGQDGHMGEISDNMNEYREGEAFRGIFFRSEGVDQQSEQWGTMGLVVLGEDEVSYRTNWLKYHWGSSSLDFWDDFSGDGILENRPENENDAPMASLASRNEIPVGGQKDFRFLITWHFPNRQAWGGGWQEKIDATVGNYYTTQYADAWEVVEKVVPRIEELEKQTMTFVNTFLKSDVPEVIKEAALFNLAHLRTQLVFRIKDGKMFGWEGNFENEGACFGSCTHVWNYEQTTAFLFGTLAKTMREVEFGYATDEQGLMSFRVHLPLDSAQKWGKAAADGQMGSIMQFYREWQLSGDDNFLKEHWNRVKKALKFSWIEGGWDADQDGVMEGAQHNTMDVEYYGPNPQMGFWYLGALRASEEMANYLGDKEFAAKCRRLYESGSKWIDNNLFNGEYYEHIIEPPMSKENVSSSLLVGMGADDLTKPDYQLGKGVLVDQLIGQLMAHFVGLGYLGKEENIKKTHQAIMKYNYREDLTEHVNVMRSYAMADESALLMAAYPDDRPEIPFPYFSEVMTGFEYTAAVGMLYEGQIDNGLKCIQSIRDRYDGRKRSPFNEAEYGNHYARAMIAWGGLLALTGFNYSAVQKSIMFTDEPGKYFWSNGYQYGRVEIKDNGDTKLVRLSSVNGDLDLDIFELKDYGKFEFEGTKRLKSAQEIEFEVEKG